MSWTNPAQVQLSITIDKSDSTTTLGFYAIISKLMLSASPACNNVCTNSRFLIHDLINAFLLNEGLNENAVEAGIRNPMPVRMAWDAVLEEEDGAGWLNHGVDPTREIENPLYNGITELPVYGGLIHPVPFDSYDHSVALEDPPILGLILNALTLLGGASRKGNSDTCKMISNTMSLTRTSRCRT